MLLISGWLLVACGAPHPGAGADAGQVGLRSDVDIPAFVAAHAQGAKVVDVRTPGEFAAGHVPGAVNLPLNELRADDPRLPEGEPLYVICEVGGRSSRAADTLAAAGRSVVNVQGGTRAWRDAGQPVE